MEGIIPNKGFTLLELLIIIAIIGILSTIAVINLRSVKYTADDSTRENEIRQIMTALEVYFYENGEYPPSDPDDHTGSYTSVNWPCVDGPVAICRSTQNSGVGEDWIPDLYTMLSQDLPIDLKNTDDLDPNCDPGGGGTHLDGTICTDFYYGYARVNALKLTLPDSQPESDTDSYALWYFREGGVRTDPECGGQWGSPYWSMRCVVRD